MAIYFLAKRGTPSARFPYAWISSDSAEYATMIETVIEAGDFTFKAENGSVSAPGYTFVGESPDYNTGIYRVAADSLGITTGGLDTARFWTTGGVSYSYMPTGTFTIPGIGFIDPSGTVYKSGFGVETSGSKSLLIFAEAAGGTAEYVAAATMNVGFGGAGNKQFIVAPNASAGAWPALAFWHNAPVPGEQVTGFDSVAYTSIDAVINATKSARFVATGIEMDGNTIFFSPDALASISSTNDVMSFTVGSWTPFTIDLNNGGLTFTDGTLLTDSAGTIIASFDASTGLAYYQEAKSVAAGGTSAMTGPTHGSVLTITGLNAAAGASQSITLTGQTWLYTGSLIHCSVNNYSGTMVTNGIPYVEAYCAVNGTLTVRVTNIHGANALSGNLKLTVLWE